MVELKGFDSNVVEPTGKFTPVPIDDYLAMITASEMKDTKPAPNKQPGRYLQLTFEIIDGEYKGRKIFTQLNLENASTTTVEIAQRTLSAICRCTGVLRPNTSEELHGIPIVISVGIRPASGNFDESNVIKGYSRTDGKELKDITDTPVVAAPKFAAAAAAATKAGGPVKAKKPWER